MSDRFIVMRAGAQVQGRAKQFGPYYHVAVVELEEGFAGMPLMVSERAKGVKRIVWDSGACHGGGRTMRSAWQQALTHAHELAAELNGK